MASKRHNIFFSIVSSIIFIISSSCLCDIHDRHLHHHEDPLSYNKYLDGYGYDSQAYPTPYLFNTEDHEGKLFKLRTETLSSSYSSSKSTVKTFSVDDFGAKGDGRTDDSQAFLKAWQEACSYAGAAVMEVPEEKTYLLKQVTFKGPCKANTTVQIYGNIEASADRSDYTKDGSRHWLRFDAVQNLLVQGGGTINGNGKIWWKNSCKINKSLPCKDAPTALTFYDNKYLVVKNLNIRNAQQIHVAFQKSMNVLVSSLKITSPGDSPNTDGIHITDVQNIHVTNSVIGTGDDCISIVSGSENVQADDITCGPGHGISIGSLGSGNSMETVSGVTVNGAKLTGTTNGVRIKTWQGGSGYASNIKFQNIEMDNVTNPIIIDQHYCDQGKPCKEQSKAVQVKNVVYQNIKGRSASKVAINFDCSKKHPCQGIVLQNIKLEGESDETVEASCNNVKVAQIGVVSPQCS